MTDLCCQCSIRENGKDAKALAGQTTARDSELGRYAEAVCSGCGSTMVDHAGVCVDPNCLYHHGTQPSERL